MSYLQKEKGLLMVGAGAADVLTATGVHSYSYAVMRKMKVQRLLALVTTLVAADTTAPVVTVKRRPTYGSAVGEVSLGTLTIPDATAVGKVLYKDINPADVFPGDEIVFEVTTAAADSGVAAGGAVYDVVLEDCPEVPGNLSDMIASA